MVYQFVNASGDNSNSGLTKEAPVATPYQAMVNIIGAGENGSHMIFTDSSTYSISGGALGHALGSYTGDRLNIMAETGSNGLPIVSPILDGGNSNGTGGSVSTGAIRLAAGWVVRGITFQNFIPIDGPSGYGVIYAQTLGASTNPEFALTIEDCVFRHITGSCINIGQGSNDNGLHKINRNKFYDICLGGSGSYVVTIGAASNKKMKVTNNLFYDLQFLDSDDGIIMGGGTRGPATIISHNVFGTSSIEALNESSIQYPNLPVKCHGGKLEYNIAYKQTVAGSAASFFTMNGGEARYNITFGLAGANSGNAPFAGTTDVTASVGNLTSDPLFKGTPDSALVGTDAATNGYKLRGPTSPAFDAAIGSSDVTTDITGEGRVALDAAALETGVFDIGALELTGLYSTAVPDSLPQEGGDFVINRIPNADNQFKRGLRDSNEDVLGRDVDQLPLTTAINGAVPTFIRKRPTANTQSTSKKSKG